MRKVYTKKDSRVLDEDGKEIVKSSAFYDFDDLLHQQLSAKHLATQGDISIFDALITSEIKLSGGEVWICAGFEQFVGDEDFVEFSIVDKDDVLGYFPYFGLTKGIDVLEIAKFVHNEYILKETGNYYSDLASNVPGAATVMGGLYRRAVYNSVNSTGDIKFISKYFYYKIK